MKEVTNSYQTLVGNMKRGGHLEDLGVDGKIILIWILTK